MNVQLDNMENDIKKKRIRKTKKEQFLNEQLVILNNLNNILHINEKHNSFILDEIKNDINVQNQILSLEEDVKKYFAYKKWPYFNKQLENGWLCLLRSIYKALDYNITYKQKMKDGQKYTEYYVNKNV